MIRISEKENKNTLNNKGLYAVITHELKNLLAGALGYCELLQRTENSLNDKEKRYIDNLHSSLILASKITSLVDACNATPNKKIVNLKYVIKQVAALNFYQLQNWDIMLDIDDVDEKCNILGDEFQLILIFNNLITNSIQALKNWQGERTISIKTLYSDGNIVVVLKDTGVGINENIIFDIFTPFFTTKKRGDGTGLGLAIVKQLVESHGGYINCYSEGLGKGCLFKLEFPKNF